MNRTLKGDIEAWEGEGGAGPAPAGAGGDSKDGTPSREEWAARIKRRVKAELDRVASEKAMSGEQAG